MSQYKIHSRLGNSRGLICRILADYAEIDYEFVNLTKEDMQSEKLLSVHPLGKIPVLECPEGKLFETAAIARYFARKAKKHQLLGSNTFEEAQVNQWVDFINLELLKTSPSVIYPILGFVPMDEEAYKKGKTAMMDKLQVINDHLNHNTFLVGDQVTVADVFLAATLSYLFSFVLDEGYKKSHVSLGRYYRLMIGQPQLKKYYRKAFACKTPWVQVKADKAAPKEKKEKQKEQPKKKEEKKVEKVEEPAKVGDPLQALPPSSFNLYDFKTFIVNEKDKQKGVAEFWKQFDPKGYSIWHIKYDKYEGEGEKLFLTSNLKDSFLQRLDSFRKYVFGTYGVYGEPGEYNVEGVWVWRGTEHPQQIKDLPNYEYHFWTRLDEKSEKDRALLEEFWLNMEEDKSKVKGQVARDVGYFK